MTRWSVLLDRARRAAPVLVVACFVVASWALVITVIRAWWSLGSAELRIVAIALWGFAGAVGWLAVLVTRYLVWGRA